MTPGPSQMRARVAPHHRRYVPSMFAYGRDQEPLTKQASDEKILLHKSNSRNTNVRTSSSFTKVQKPLINEARIELIAPEKKDEKTQAKAITMQKDLNKTRNEQRERSKSAFHGKERK